MNTSKKDPKPEFVPPKQLNRADNIAYSEHLLRRTIQKQPLRSSIKKLPLHIENDLLEHRKNLPLYLHRLTAELKRKNGPQQTIRELFTSKNPDRPIVVLPNLAKNRPPARFEFEKEFKLPNDPLTRKVFEELTHQEPVDYFVIETPATEEKKKEKFIKKPEQTVDEKVREIIRNKLEEDLSDKLDKCYREYAKIRITERLRQLTVQEANHLQSLSRKPKNVLNAPILTCDNPRVVQFFTTQTLEAPPSPKAQENVTVDVNAAETDEINTRMKEEEEDEKLIEDICKKQDVKLCEFFNIEENAFNRKYFNQFYDELKKTRSLSGWSMNLMSPRNDKIRMFDTLELDDHDRHTKLYGKKLFGINDEIAKRRERDFLFDQYTLARGVRLNKNLAPEKNSKRRMQVIMQTKYRQDPLEEDPSNKIKIEKVTISTGEDARLIKNTEKFIEMFPKSAKKLTSSQGNNGWLVEAINKLDTADEVGMMTERITFDDDEKDVINKIFKSSTYHSRATSDRLGTTASTFSELTLSPRPTTNMSTVARQQRVKAQHRLNFAKIKQNKEETKEIRSTFNDFYDDLFELTLSSKEETDCIDLQIMEAATEVGKDYLRIRSVHDQEVIKNLAKEFTNLQKKNKFKHKLVYLLSSKIIDKKGLLEEYDKLMKEEALRMKLLQQVGKKGKK